MILRRGCRFLVIAIQPFGQHINALTPSGVQPVRLKPTVFDFIL